MKEQIPYSPEKGSGEQDQDSEPKGLERPALPKLPRRIKEYRCEGIRQELDLTTGRLTEFKCGTRSENSVNLCYPVPVYEGEDEEEEEKDNG